MAAWDLPEGKHPFPLIDTEEDLILVFVGRKKSGKSAAAREVFRQWPDTDRLLIDINADCDPGADLDPIRLPADPPLELPPRRRKDAPDTYWWQANAKSPTFRDDLDRAIGLALYPKERRVLIWVDEAGVLFKVHQCGPNSTAALHQNRHYRVPLLLCMPRPKVIDPLCISQADRIQAFDVPSPGDRRWIAENAGIPPVAYDREYLKTKERGQYWSTLYINDGDKDVHGLYRVPPMPLTRAEPADAIPPGFGREPVDAVPVGIRRPR